MAKVTPVATVVMATAGTGTATVSLGTTVGTVTPTVGTVTPTVGTPTTRLRDRTGITKSTALVQSRSGR